MDSELKFFPKELWPVLDRKAAKAEGLMTIAEKKRVNLSRMKQLDGAEVLDKEDVDEAPDDVDNDDDADMEDLDMDDEFDEDDDEGGDYNAEHYFDNGDDDAGDDYDGGDGDGGDFE